MPCTVILLDGCIDYLGQLVAEVTGPINPSGEGQDLGGASMDRPIPAVPIEDSVQEEYIVCLEDGKRLRLLKRYLMAQYGMTPAEYRNRWGLPSDYPMVAPAVSAQRRGAALERGLGKPEVNTKTAAKPSGSRRRPAGAAKR